MDIERQLYNFILDYWRMIKKYAKQPEDPETWDDLIAEAGALNTKHNQGNAEGRFFTKCIMAWFEYLSERDTAKGRADINL